jgi:hypothetical protein
LNLRLNDFKNELIVLKICIQINIILTTCREGEGDWEFGQPCLIPIWNERITKWQYFVWNNAKANVGKIFFPRKEILLLKVRVQGDFLLHDYIYNATNTRGYLIHKDLRFLSEKLTPQSRFACHWHTQCKLDTKSVCPHPTSGTGASLILRMLYYVPSPCQPLFSYLLRCATYLSWISKSSARPRRGVTIQFSPVSLLDPRCLVIPCGKHHYHSVPGWVVMGKK